MGCVCTLYVTSHLIQFLSILIFTKNSFCIVIDSLGLQYASRTVYNVIYRKMELESFMIYKFHSQ